MSPTMPTIVQWVRRRHDGLSLRWEFHNMRRAGRGSPRVVRADALHPSYVVITFPPQHLSEQLFYQGAGGVNDPHPPDPRPVAARLAGPTRLAFRLPDDLDVVPLEIASLLDWLAWVPSLVPAALPPGGARRRDPLLRPPEAHETAIELPWWLLLSPDRKAAWAHAGTPVTHSGRTELWHTRLAVKRRGPGGPVADESEDVRRTVRAVWTRDPQFTPWISRRQKLSHGLPIEPAGRHMVPDIGQPFHASLTPEDRYAIVASSADYVGHTGGDQYEPAPLEVRQLMLTPSGGWVDAHGQWDTNATDLSLLGWTQRSAHGRDSYVRVVNLGSLAWLPHRAVRIDVVERRVQPTAGTGPGLTAYLRLQTFVQVRQPVVDYREPGSHVPDGGRGLPFVRSQLLTTTTPALDEPHDYFSAPPSDLGRARVFVPTVSGTPFPFLARLTDWAGRTHDVSVPLVFVDHMSAKDPVLMSTFRDLFNAAHQGASDSRPVETLGVDLAGEVAVAAPSTPGGDDTNVTATRLRCGLTAPVGAPQDGDYAPWFTPVMQQATLRSAAAEEVAGRALPPSEMIFDPSYVSGGFANTGEIFLNAAATATPTTVTFAEQGRGDRVGGAVEPAFQITALSRRNGVMGGDDLNGLRAGVFDPQDFFPGGSTFLGGIPLRDVIEKGSFDDAPRLEYDVVRDGSGQKVGGRSSLRWLGRLQDHKPSQGPSLLSASNGTVDLSVVRFNDLLDPTRSTSEVVLDLRDFTVHLFGTEPPLAFLKVSVKRLRFASLSGSKPDVTVDLADVTFGGVLKFIDKLDPLLSSVSDGQGLAIDVTGSGVRAGYSLAVPSVEIGVFSLQNISLTSAVHLPFDGSPVRCRFAFCTRENPFLLTVSGLGGGGFVGLAVGVDGIEMVEAALEAGAQIALNLGVASGNVHAFLGLYFKVAVVDGEDRVTLTGYTRVGGRLRVLGLISASVEFNLGFTYQAETNKVTGQASLTVDIDVFLFSGSVKLTIERRYGGSGDPSFADVMKADDWAAYAAAFAA